MTREPVRAHWRDEAVLRVGISSCLLGEEVRWDGGHKRDRFLTDTLAPYVEWVPVCPELEVGMGIPREPVQLRKRGEEILMLETKSGRDWTREMRSWSASKVRALDRLDLCGYVLKRDSPSCGMERVKVRCEKGMPKRDGRGLFATALIERFPTLPVEEEGRLHDAGLRDNFIERIFAYRRLRSLFSARWNAGRIVAFHTAHKLELMAHSPQAYRSLGRLVAEVRQIPPAEFRERYEREFMDALKRSATRRRHVNVLQHCVGYLRKHIDAEARAELGQLIVDYGDGLLPLIVPITMIRHYVRRFGIDYLAGQLYLEPHPKELMLRNHV